MNKTSVANFISHWIVDQAKAAKAESLVVGVSGGVDSALVAALCQEVVTGLPVIGVIMPCHSSPSAIKRAYEVTGKFCNKSILINLETSFASISTQSSSNDDVPLSASGALRSCLRAPTLDYIAKLHNGIIVGTGNRDEDEVTRYFQKRGDGAVDISPIAKLHKSEVYELAAHLGVPTSVLEATPSADLWGPDAGQTDEGQLGMTYDEIEWAIQTATKGSPYADADAELLLNASLSPGLTDREKQVLRNLADMEVASRHKKNPFLPVCEVRDVLNEE